MVLLILSCSNNKNYYSNPESKLLEKLNTHKIVMLADFGHSRYLPYYTLTKFLNEWLSAIENNHPMEKNFTLVLEADQEITDIINNFLQTGKRNEIVEFWPPYNSLETLEFYENFIYRRRYRRPRLSNNCYCQRN